MSPDLFSCVHQKEDIPLEAQITGRGQEEVAVVLHLASSNKSAKWRWSTEHKMQHTVIGITILFKQICKMHKMQLTSQRAIWLNVCSGKNYTEHDGLLVIRKAWEPWFEKGNKGRRAHLGLVLIRKHAVQQPPSCGEGCHHIGKSLETFCNNDFSSDNYVFSVLKRELFFWPEYPHKIT